MATLTIGTSVSSSHKEDLYSTTGEYWIKIDNVSGNYFSDNSSCPGGNLMDFQVRISGTDIWKSVGGCNDFNYYDYPCYQYCQWNFLYGRYDKPSDSYHTRYIDKIAVTYLGLRNESFVNRCHVNITSVDNNNIPLRGVKILESNIPTTNDTNFMAWTLENSGERICEASIRCRDPNYTELTGTLKGCNSSEISLMQSQKQNDIILIETYGIPTKLTFTISTPGIYDGSLHCQYWNGTDWVYFPESGVVDETNGFRNHGVKNINLPIVSDWKKSTLGDNPQLFYICRLIFDSISSVTAAPKASCLRWDGSYETITDSDGLFNFTLFTSGGKSINVPGTLVGYICTSGNGAITIPETTSDKEIKLVLVKSNLSNNITCPSIVYKYQSKTILTSSTVDYGTISNTLTISSPKTETIVFNPSSGTDVPTEYTFKEETVYKIQLKSVDLGGNTIGKTCYVNVTSAPSCDILTDQFSCESNSCFWSGDKCISNDPHVNLSNIYDSIIDKTICISEECINILDLNNDGIINVTDKDLSSTLTYDETLSKILSYQICGELNPCKESKSKNILLYIGAGLTVGYLGYKLLIKK